MLSVFFETLGCQMNVADSEMLAELLAQQGYHTTQDVRKANLIIVNTCSVRDHAEQRARARVTEYVGIIKKSPVKPKPAIWVIGCMAQRLGDQLKSEIPGISRVIGAMDLGSLGDKIDTYLSSVEAGLPANESPSVVTAFVPIMRGCDNYCAYCVVPFVRGREHSLPEKELFETVKRLIDKGVKEITVLGQNVNSYKDPKTGANFSHLLKHIHDINGLLRIRFMTSHPKDCSTELIQTIADLPKACKHFHLPVQSGSTRILQLMNRKYSREEYVKLVEHIRKTVPDVDITTDIMTGFPGETEDDFSETLSLVKATRFTSVFMFAYSPRPGTAAEKMPGTVHPTVAKERLKELIAIQTEITKEHYAAMVGKSIQVLCTERQAEEPQLWMGQDFGCKRVLVACDTDLTGTILNARVRSTSGMTLLCERK
jgi:tRNA-2-methylthio-N6-dimethylallyladenosine synthase